MIREVALARFSLPLPEHPGQNLDVRVALIRDLCRQVPDDQRPEDEDGPRRWDEKPDGTHEDWLDASWLHGDERRRRPPALGGARPPGYASGRGLPSINGASRSSGLVTARIVVLATRV